VGARGGAGLTVGPQPKREPDWSDEVVELRERLARLEVGAEGHERASGERHERVLEAFVELRARLEKAEERTWKVLAAVAVIAAGSGAGGVEIAKAILGGG
jgi:hypothetical protein